MTQISASTIVPSTPGAVTVVSSNGTVSVYTPTTVNNPESNFAAFRAALAGCSDYDCVLLDPRVTYQYDGTEAVLLNKSGVDVVGGFLTRGSRSYERIVELDGCTGCRILDQKFDGEAGIYFATAYPVTIASIGATNPNAVGASTPTYVYSLINSCKDCALSVNVRDHAGNPQLNATGFPFFFETHAIYMSSSAENCTVFNSKFRDIGYSAIVDNGVSCTISGFEIHECGWHAITIRGSGDTFIRDGLITETFRTTGRRTGIDENGSKDSVFISGVVMHHDYDYIPNIAQWDVGTSYVVDDQVFNSSEVYIAVSPITGGSAPTHTSGTVGAWMWAAPLSGDWSIKSQSANMHLNSVRITHGRMGRDVNDNQSIRCESGAASHYLTDCHLDGVWYGRGDAETDLYISSSHLNLQGHSRYSVVHTGTGMNTLKVDGCHMHYKDLAYNLTQTPSPDENTWSSENTIYHPTDTSVSADTRIFLESQIDGLQGRINFGRSNKIEVDGVRYHDGVDGAMGTHRKSDTDIGRLSLSTSGEDDHVLMLDSSLTGVFAHPATGGGSPTNLPGLPGIPGGVVKHQGWTGAVPGGSIATNVERWLWDGTDWIPQIN